MNKLFISLAMVLASANFAMADVSPTPTPTASPVAVEAATAPAANPSDVLAVKAVELMDWVQSTASKTTDFLAEQTPLFVKELLLWEFYYHFFWFGVSVVLFAGLIFFRRTAFMAGAVPENTEKAFKKSSYDRNLSESSEVGLYYTFRWLKALSYLMTIVVCIIVFNITWVKIWMAPRVYLVEYAQSMVK